MSAGLALSLRVTLGAGTVAARPADQFLPENGVVDELDVRLPPAASAAPSAPSAGT
jgi:hypothetical protein